MSQDFSCFPPASLAFGEDLAAQVSGQIMDFVQAAVDFHKAEGGKPKSAPYGKSWGKRRLLSTWSTTPDAYDTAHLSHVMQSDFKNFDWPSISAHAKLQAEPLRQMARARLGTAVSAMRHGLALLGSRTTFGFTVAVEKDFARPTVALTIDAHCLHRQDTPVLLPGLRNRLIPVFAGLHALEQALPCEGPSASIWGWENHPMRVAAPSAVHAWYKTLILHEPFTAFTRAKGNVHLSPPVLYLDPHKVADGIADVRRALCPKGTQFP